MARSRIVGGININVLLAFIFGVLFLFVILGLVVFVRDLSDMARWVIVIIIALAGAGFAAVIPGILVIELPYIRSGGALAVFVLVLTNQPGIVKKAMEINPPDVRPTIMEYLSNVDSGKIDIAWESLDALAKKTIAADRSMFTDIYENAKDVFGKVVARSKPTGMNMMTNPAGYPEGTYQSLSFKTKFTSGCHEEALSARLSDAGSWHVFNHIRNPMPTSCTGTFLPVITSIEP